MSLVLDAGALIAVERGDREVIALLKRERQQGRAPLSHGGVLGQVWRGDHGHQAGLARLLPALDVQPLDETLGRKAGVLLGAAGSTDVIDAAVVVLSRDGDDILTSDPDDLQALARAAGRHLELIAV
ncbi:MAG: hypothetical protein KY440_10775 [Actinobacteria bacterium]|nr:hypothetical protein [Actinomycetota bacterium]